jgi:DNA-binding response OmpR family regulator
MPSKANPTAKAVLVVEDDPAVRKLVRGFLEAMGCAVTEASDGAKALAALDGGSFELVVLDLMLPESSGYDVLEAMRARKLTATPVIMMSARGLPEDRAHAEELGAVLYLIKPFTRADFTRAVKLVLEGRP